MGAMIKSKLDDLKIKKSEQYFWIRLIGLFVLLVLAAGLRFYRLETLGYANHYYSAAVVSMLQSWHNFFFAAAEPGGAVSVDKPPVGLWLQTISAAIFGVNSLGLLLPQLLSGIGSIFVLFHLVQRRFGYAAGWIAGATMAVLPVAIATDRNNTIDSILMFTLLLAAWAFIKATEKNSLRWLLLGGTLVGIGFNIKMLEAYLPVPAFFALYLLAAREGIWRKVGKLAAAFFLMVIVSLSWAVIVDLTPATARPFVGSSGDNSEMTLIFGYNGLQRLVGMARGGFGQGYRNGNGFPGGRPSGSTSGSTAQNPPNGQFNPGNGANPPSGGSFPAGGPAGSPPGMVNMDGGNRFTGGYGGQLPEFNGAASGQNGPSARDGNNRTFMGGRPQGGGGGQFNIGQAGPLRLFQAPLDREASWLLPMALAGLVLLLVRGRFSWPLSMEHSQAVLWGVWLITVGIFFSVAQFFHEYYLVTMGASLAALAGIAFAEFWRLFKEKRWLGAGLFSLTALVTVWFELRIAGESIQSITWQPYTWFALILGIILLVSQAALPRMNLLAKIGSAWMIGAMLISPTIWSAYTALYQGGNASLPAAYSGGDDHRGDLNTLSVDQNLVDFLQKNTVGVRYLMAVPSSMQGSDYILATGRPVLYLGGFMGSDSVLTTEGLQELVEKRELRYIYNGGQGGGGMQSGISNWVSEHCTLVEGYNTLTQNTGAPDGTGTPRQGGQNISLYDCFQSK
jgi:4-amino-4-deoxy-L-arabinose transferase-like glycosyltransferase